MTRLPFSARLMPLLALGLLALLPRHAWATTYTVTDTSDSVTDTGSLRYAVSQAHTGDTINITTTGNGVVVEGSTLTISQGVTINGPTSGTFTLSGDLNGYGCLTVSGSSTVTINNITLEDALSNSNGGGLSVASGANVNLVGCTITGNGAPSGGGIYNAGTLSVFNCTVTGNSAPSGSGGGIDNAASLILTDSSLSENAAGHNSPGSGGGLYNESTGSATLNSDLVFDNSSGLNGGGIDNARLLTLDNTVVAANTAADSGGGVYSTGTSGQLGITGSSFSGNLSSTGQGDGVYSGGTPTYLFDDIIYDLDTNSSAYDVLGLSSPDTIYANHCDFVSLSSGENIVTPSGSSVSTVNPGFVTPATAGSDTACDLHLQATSPLIGQGAASATENGANVADTTSDFDGFTRPSTPAEGAYDAPQSNITVNNTGDTGYASGSLAVNVSDATTLRAAIGYANDYTSVAIGFDSTVFATAQTISLSYGTLNQTVNTLTLSAPMMITGPSAGVIINGQENGTILSIANTSGLVQISGLTIKNAASAYNSVSGSYTGGSDVAVNTNANATLTDCTLTGTVSGNPGAGLAVSAGGTATLTGCTVGGNSDYSSGAGISNLGTLTLTGSIVGPNSCGQHDGGGIYNDGTLTIQGSTSSGGITPSIIGYGLINGVIVGGQNNAVLGGGIYNDAAGTLTVSNTTFGQNNGESGGGAIYNVSANATTLTNCLFVGNGANGAGGGIFNGASGSPAILDVLNSTFTGNSATNGGGALASYGGALLLNDVLYGDTGGLTGGAGNEDDSAGSPQSTDTAAYCDIEDPFTSDGLTDGSHNLSPSTGGPNPNFVASFATAPGGIYNLHPANAALEAGGTQAAISSLGVGAYTVPSDDYTGTPQTNPPTIGAYDDTASGGGTTTPATVTFTALSPGATSYTTAQAITLSATLTPAAATGTVTFNVVSGNQTYPFTAVGSGSGAYSDTVPAGTLPAGTYTFSALFTSSNTGAYTNANSTSNPTFTVTAATGTTSPTATIVSTPAPTTTTTVVAGSSATISVAITPASVNGTVTVTLTPTTGTATTLTATETAAGSGTYTVATPTTLAVGSYAVSASFAPTTSGYTGSSQQGGTLTVTAASSPPTALTTFPGGALQMVALDETYTSFAEALDNMATPPAYDTWNGSAYSLTNSATEAAPAPGTGFWIYPTGTLTVYNTGTAASGTVTVPLHQGWNLIGNPFSVAFPLSSLSVNGVSGFANANLDGLLYGTLYTWGSGNTTATGYTTLGASSRLQPFTGYWLYAFQSGETLTFTATG